MNISISKPDTTTLSDEQKTAYVSIIDHLDEVSSGDIFQENTWISLKGPAGVGKTYTLKTIVQHLLSQGKKIAMIAPTHQAVKVARLAIGFEHKNLKYSSLHGFLYLRPGDINPETGEQKFTVDTKAKSKDREIYDVVILDESSMVSIEMFKILSNEIVAGDRVKSFLFVGDEYQLLPVEINVDKDKKYIHSVYDNPNVNHYDLSTLVRNPNMEVINFVTDIRKMIANNGTKQDLIKYIRNEQSKSHDLIRFYKTKKELITEFLKKDRLGDASDVIATFTNDNVNIYNDSIRAYYTKLDGVTPEIHTEDMFVVQDSIYNETGDSFYNSEILKLKYSMFEEFNFKGKKFKGYRCVTDDDREFLKLADESKEAYQKTLDILKSNAVLKKDREMWKMFYELKAMFLVTRPQFANTIHKLQGSSYENVFVDVSGLQYMNDSDILRLFYVACTRSQNIVHIHI